MRLAIADPPYLGTAAATYGPGACMSLGNQMRGGTPNRRRMGDGNPDAHLWDDPEQHRLLVAALMAGWDRWAISTNATSLRHYLHWVPEQTRVCAWVIPDPMPVGRIIKAWQPVLLYAPNVPRDRDKVIRDTCLTHKTRGKSTGRFAGYKPPEWTRWVLDMLGYDPDTDTVDDLFGGSGSVTAEINQGVLL